MCHNPAMLTPKIAVITAAYNAELYLRQTIESVLAQSFADFEYLIVDDGSTDMTLQIAREFKQKDPRIHVISIMHQGVSGARNAALRLTQCEFVSFIDGDDIWHPNFLECSLKEISRQSQNCVGTFCWSLFIDRYSRPMKKTAAPEVKPYYTYDMLLGICPPGNGSALFLKRRHLEEAGLFDERIVYGSEDSELWYRILELSGQYFLQCIPQMLCKYRRHEKSLTVINKVAALEEKEEFVLKRDLQSFSRTQKTKILLSFASHAYGQESDLHLWIWSVKALLCQPLVLFQSRLGCFALLTALLGPGPGKKIRQLYEWLVLWKSRDAIEPQPIGVPVNFPSF